jgi:quinohemoprotein ethanol dehydrogenase
VGWNGRPLARYCAFAALIMTAAGRPGLDLVQAESAQSADGGSIAAAAGSELAYRAIPGSRDGASNPQDWTQHGRTYSEQRYSPLDDINEATIKDLRLAWSFKIDPNRELEATPIVVDGTMYVTGSYSIVYALDAASGRLLWRFDPQVSRGMSNQGCCGPVNRGVAVWKGRVYVGAFDGRLISVDAATGHPVWSVDTVIDHTRNYTVTGAPRVVRGRVIIGNAGAEFGTRGYVTAYDANSGALAWRFFTVPGDPRQPAENEEMKRARLTWQGRRYAEYQGGGPIWDSMSFDAKLNLLYVGVGNGSTWSRKLRSEGRGDNLFLSSIVALNADTGAYVWHYQLTPGDEWDFDATQQMILADLNIGGTIRKTLMQASKNGFFYVLDRSNGHLISAEPYVPVSWATGIDLKSGRPIEDDARYEDGKLKLVMPAPSGAHNWHSMAYHPESGMVYIPAMLGAMYYRAVNDAPMPEHLGTANVGAFMTFGILPADNTVAASAANIPDLRHTCDWKRVRQSWKGRLIAWDPIHQRAVWTRDYASHVNGGVLALGTNLIFQGTGDGRLVAYRATDGVQVWETRTNTGVIAAPITYRVGAEQYVAIAAGWGGGQPLAMGPIAGVDGMRTDARMLVFKLHGSASLPAPLPPRGALEVLSTDSPVDEARTENGRLNYGLHCGPCHGPEAMAGGSVPDLRFMSQGTYAAFPAIVKGALSANGMPSFSDSLSAGEIENIRQYIARRNADLRGELSADQANAARCQEGLGEIHPAAH